MKIIGLIGGLSWESSAEYYRMINEGVRERLGGLHSADSVMYSFDFHEIEALQSADDWAEATRRMVQAGQRLERADADCIVICSNTMHKMAEAVQDAVKIPLLHLADTTARQIVACNLSRIGLLGTRFTMEQDFYKGRLHGKFGLDVLVPDEAGRRIVDRVIYDELCRGEIKASSKQAYLDVIQELIGRGAQGIILGCTEITLLIK